jgi:hypothetical protein
MRGGSERNRKLWGEKFGNCSWNYMGAASLAVDGRGESRRVEESRGESRRVEASRGEWRRSPVPGPEINTARGVARAMLEGVQAPRRELNTRACPPRCRFVLSPEVAFSRSASHVRPALFRLPTCATRIPRTPRPLVSPRPGSGAN